MHNIGWYLVGDCNGAVPPGATTLRHSDPILFLFPCLQSKEFTGQLLWRINPTRKGCRKRACLTRRRAFKSKVGNLWLSRHCWTITPNIPSQHEQWPGVMRAVVPHTCFKHLKGCRRGQRLVVRSPRRQDEIEGSTLQERRFGSNIFCTEGQIWGEH